MIARNQKSNFFFFVMLSRIYLVPSHKAVSGKHSITFSSHYRTTLYYRFYSRPIALYHKFFELICRYGPGTKIPKGIIFEGIDSDKPLEVETKFICLDLIMICACSIGPNVEVNAVSGVNLW